MALSSAVRYLPVKSAQSALGPRQILPSPFVSRTATSSKNYLHLFHPNRHINIGPLGNIGRPGRPGKSPRPGGDGTPDNWSPNTGGNSDGQFNPYSGGGFGGQPPPRMEAWVNPDAMPPGEFLMKYARDLTELAKAGKIDPVIGREEEIRRTIQVLSRRTKNNPVLIGEPGVGKTAIAEGLALRIINGEVPDSIKTKRVLALDLPALVAGTKFRGEFEERMRGILRDTQKLQGQIILFIDELHLLVGAGSAEGSMDASNMLKPALARGELHCVGATTLNEYRKYIEKDAALARRFQSVLITEPTVNDTISILRGLKEKYELHHGVRITDGALVAAAVLSNRYITDRFLPDKAIDLIDEAASRLRLQQESKPEALEDLDRAIITLKIEREALKKESDAASQERLANLEKDLRAKEDQSAELTRTWHEERNRLEKTKRLKEEIERVQFEAARAQRLGDLARVSELIYGRLPSLKAQLPSENDKEQNRLLSDAVTDKDIASVIARATGIPMSSFAQGEKEKLLHMEKFLSDRVVGQQQAIAAISNVVRIARAGLHAHTRPLGSFLFLGPTGVGKTELCKSLAGFLFNTEHALIRIDMSEYMEKHSVARLIGAPPGYVGYEEGGALTEAVRRRPYAVILLDEFEKAHREVSNLMLQVLDEGRLTDSQGRTVDFRNTIIIMTSNLGAQHLAGLPEGAPSTAAQEFVMEDVRAAFAPEFLNRVDEIVLFNRLSREQMLPIVSIQLSEITKTLEAKKIHLEVDKPTQQLLATQGYDPVYGARPLKRVIQRMLLNPLSKLVLEGKILENDKVRVHSDAKKDVLSFKVVGRVKSKEEEVHTQSTKKPKNVEDELHD